MSSTLQKAVTRVLSPLVRLLLRHGVSHGEFSSWAKQAYVREASQHFGLNEKTPTVSRMAIVTGINRKEVKRLLELPAEIEPGIAKHNRALRVVTGWLQDAEFHTQAGEPSTLTYGETGDTFNELVRRYGGDVPARALLDELVRVGTVKQDGSEVELLTHGYVPHESQEAMLDLFATSASDLLETLEFNLSDVNHNRLQLSVAYDNVSDEGLQAFQTLGRDKAMVLLRELDEWLKQHDLGDTPQPNSKQNRVGLGLYLIESTKERQDDDD